jgi:hypothetical protein
MMMIIFLIIFLMMLLMRKIVEKSKRNLYLWFFSCSSAHRRRTNSLRLISLHFSFRRRRHRRESSINLNVRSLVSSRRESSINSKRRHRRRQRNWCSVNSSHQFALFRRRQEINSSKRFRNSISYLRKQRSFSYREKSQSKTKSLTQASRTSRSRNAKVKLFFLVQNRFLLSRSIEFSLFLHSQRNTQRAVNLMFSRLTAHFFIDDLLTITSHRDRQWQRIVDRSDIDADEENSRWEK